MVYKPTDDLSQTRWVRVVNGSGEDIPGFAVMRITGVTSEGVYQVNKPDSTTAGKGDVLFNGPVIIADGAEGQGTRDFPCDAAYNSTDGTPAAGEIWGPKASDWQLRKAKPGFQITGNASAGVVKIRPMELKKTEFVKVTSLTKVGDYYPGKLQIVDETGSASDGDDIYIVEL